MPSISDLVGAVKQTTDLLSRETRIHYNQAAEVPLAQGRRIEFIFPAHPNGFLDLSTVHFSCIIKRTGGGLNPSATIDSTSLSQLFREVNLYHGNNHIGYLPFYSILAPTLEKIHTNSLISSKERIIDGGLVVDNTERAALGASFDAGKRYNIYFLKNTIFNCSALLPVDRLSMRGPLKLEILLENPGLVVSGAATENLLLTDVDLYCNYLFSPSLSAAKDWKINFEVDNYEYRYVNVGSNQRTTLRFGSTLSDLQYAMICLRDDSKDANPPVSASVATHAKLQNFLGYQHIDQFQLYVESRPWFAEQLNADKTQLMLWKEARKCEPNLIHSRFFTDYEDSNVNGTMLQVPIMINLQAAPRFTREMKSGVTTSRQNVEMYADVTFKQPPGSIPTTTAGTGANQTINAFCFLKHTMRVYEDQYGQLHIAK